jgi:Bacterial TniB protein
MKRSLIAQRRDRLWLPDPTREALLNDLHELGTGPKRNRQRSIAIIAQANAGKTALAKQYMQRHPEHRINGRLQVPAIYLSMSDISRVEDLSIALLRALHLPDARSGTHSQRLERFATMAERVSLGLIFLDEFHDCTDVSGRGNPFLRLIKGFLNENICVVPMGVYLLANVLAKDPQLQTRINFLRGTLTPVQSLSEIKRLMVELSAFQESEITNVAVEYVNKESGGQIGMVLDLIEECLVHQDDLSIISLQRERQKMDEFNNLHGR